MSAKGVEVVEFSPELGVDCNDRGSPQSDSAEKDYEEVCSEVGVGKKGSKEAAPALVPMLG